MATVVLTCEWCKKPFRKPNSRGPAPKFCGNAHRQAAYAKRQAEETAEELRRLKAENAELRKITRRYDKEHRDDRYDPMG